MDSPAKAADLRLRLRALLRPRDLDRRIAAGAPIADDPLLELRVRQLTSPTERRALAACFANILDAAWEREADPATRTTLDYRAVLAARSEIDELIALLRGEEHLGVRGLALANLVAAAPTRPPVHARVGDSLRQVIADVIWMMRDC